MGPLNGLYNRQSRALEIVIDDYQQVIETLINKMQTFGKEIINCFKLTGSLTPDVI